MFNNCYALIELADNDMKDGSLEKTHMDKYARDFAKLLFKQLSVKVVSTKVFQDIVPKEYYYLCIKIDNNVNKIIKIIATTKRGLIISRNDSKWISPDGKFKS